MKKTETLDEFYQKKFNWVPDNLQREIGHVNVFRLEDCVGEGAVQVQYSRRDFYKICLHRGESVYHYADKSIRVSGTTLLFFNPQVPYKWEVEHDELTGYFCIFKEAFFADKIGGPLSELPMFSIGGKPTYQLTAEQDTELGRLFERMIGEIRTDYQYKYDLIRNYVSELIHAALKMQPSETLHKHPDAKSRLSAVFIELLERQFPIESPTQRFRLRSASDFAGQLSVHVNHLNRSIRDTTGKTTTELIASRLVSEAGALLKHTDWNIADIGYCLGFEDPAHFNYFFKKQTSLTPSAFRRG